MRKTKTSSPNKAFTFNPLTGGWFRCNQTGDYTKAPKKYEFAKTRANQSAKPKPDKTDFGRRKWIPSKSRIRHCTKKA